jgi:hypothetical protein
MATGAMPSPAASAPTISTWRSLRKAWNRPMALAAADAGGDRIRQAAVLGQHLLAPRADDGVEVAHHARIGMRAGDGADDVEGVRTLVTQSRIASLSASFRVAEPEVTGTTVAPSSFMR